MPNEWPTVRIEDIAEKIAMGPFGSNIKVETFVETGVPVISGAHLRGVRLEDSDFNFVTDEHAERMKNSNVFRGDVIFTHAGNIGQVAYIPPNSQYERYVISQRQFYLRCDLSKAAPAFISYFFRSNEGQHKLLANASQTGVPSIARPSFLPTDGSAGLQAVDYCDGALIARATISVEVEASCNFTFSVKDGIDKDMVCIGGAEVRASDSIEVDVLITFLDPDSDNPKVDAVELVPAYRHIDFGSIEPDYGDEDPNDERY